MIRALIIVVFGAIMFFNPGVGRSQKTWTSDFPKEQVDAATKELDEFLKAARNDLRLPIVVTEQQKKALVVKYLGEAAKSPFFWVNLKETFRSAKEDYNSWKGWNRDDKVAAYVVRESYENVMSSKWGSLVLSSEPSGADVWLKSSSARTKEGQTRISRRYPEGPYTFVVELQGYKRKQVQVNIDRNKPVEEKVTLEKQ